MDELRNLEEIFSATRKIVEKLQAENNLLAEENLKLREMNQKILSENERLQKINENFGKNLQHFHFAMQNEFQKFLTAASSTNGENFDEEKKIVVPVENETEILDAEENLPANLNQPKKKMVYAEFFAEEVGFKEN